jgi:hypothetical protein
VILKSPDFYTGHVKLDFFGYPSYVGDFHAQHPLKPAANKEESPADAQPVKPVENTSKPAVSASGEAKTTTAVKGEEPKKNPTGWLDEIRRKKLGFKQP